MPLKMGTVVLEKYNEDWPKMFQKEKKNLEKLLGDRVISIEHVGSTSIPGMSAKPVIDIMITVKDIHDVENFKDLFKLSDGYDLKDEGGIYGEYLVRKGTPDARTHFIHIIEDKSERYYNYVKFRDYLIRHPESFREYEDLKIELSKKYANDRKSYTASKNDFIQNIFRLYDLEKSNK